MTDETAKQTELDAFFAASRNATPLPSGDLLARIEADALAQQPVAPGGPTSTRTPGFFAQIRELVGGWPALSGLVAATAAGVWIGVSPPVSVTENMAGLLGVDSAEWLSSGGLDPLSGYEFFLSEG